jgi:hypothetical protein
MFDDLVETLGCILGLALLLSIALWGTLFVNGRLHKDDDRLRWEKEQLIERQKAQAAAESVWAINVEPELVLSRKLRVSAANAECWGPHLTDVRTAISRKDWAGLVHAARLDHPTDAVRREGFDDLSFEGAVTNMLFYLQDWAFHDGLRAYVGLSAPSAIASAGVRFLLVDRPEYDSFQSGSRWTRLAVVASPLDAQDQRTAGARAAQYVAICRYAPGTRVVMILACPTSSDQQRLTQRLENLQQQFEADVQRVNELGRPSENSRDFDAAVDAQMATKYLPAIRALADDF